MLLALGLTLAASGTWAQDDRELEGWQKRVLRALEESTRSVETPDDDDANARDEGARRQDYTRPQEDDRDAARAAAEARRRFGGSVLAVKRVGDTYRVRLLLDSGRVTTVKIED